MTDNTIKNNQWVDAKTVREHFGISISTFEGWIRKGVPCLRLNRLRRFKLDQVEEWIKNYEVSAKESD